MIKILIIYHSQSGNTKKMAQAVAKGVDTIENVRSVLKKASDADLEDLLSCNGLVVGSPEYFGYMAGQVKDFFDRTFYPAQGKAKIFKKPYAVFISAGNDGTGAMTAIERIVLGYPLKKIHDPVVAKGPISEQVLSACEELGKTIAAGCEVGIY